MDSSRIIAACAVLWFTVGCGPKYVAVYPTPELSGRPVGRLGILPLEIGTTAPGAFHKGEIEDRGPGIITDLLYDALARRPGLILSDRGDAEGAALRIRQMKPDLSLQERARALGQALDVPLVLTGRVDLFEERIGGRYGIDRPPAVGFELLLVNRDDGAVLWKGNYYETQQALFSDITTFPLFLKRGGQWQTALELAQYGVKEILDHAGWTTENGNPP